MAGLGSSGSHQLVGNWQDSFSQPAQPQQKQPKPMGLGGFLLSLLPGGSLVDKKIRGEKITGGDVATEAALTAVPFGLGKILRGVTTGAKIARGATTLAKDAAKAGEVGKVAGRTGEMARATRTAAADQPGILDKLSKSLSKPSTVASRSSLDKASKQRELVDLTQSLPGMRGSAAKKFGNVEGEIGKMTGEVDRLVKGVGTKMNSTEFGARVGKVADEIVDPAEQKRFITEYNNLVSKTFGTKVPSELTASDINKLRRGVNGQLSGVFKKIDKGTQLTDKDEALLKLRDALSEGIENLVPDEIYGQVKGLNKNIATLMGGIPEFKKASEEGVQFLGTQIPIVSQKIPQVIQGATDVAGRTLANPVTKTLTTQGATRLAADATGLRDTTAPEQIPMQDTQNTGLMLPGGDTAGMMPTDTGASEGPVFGQDKLLAALTADPDNADTYFKLYSLLGDSSQGQTNTKASNALNSLDQLEALYNQAGGGQQRLPGILQNVLGKAGESPEVNAYNQVRDGLVAGVARALGETGVLSDQDIKRYSKMLPTITDTPEEAKIKLDTLRSIMQANAGVAQPQPDIAALTGAAV